jgi:hypothetical protein
MRRRARFQPEILPTLRQYGFFYDQPKPHPQHAAPFRQSKF